MKNFIIIFLLLIIGVVSCQPEVKFNRPSPTKVEYIELLRETEDTSFYRHIRYKLDTIYYRTTLRQKSQVLPNNPPRRGALEVYGRVNLNDYLAVDDSDTDWNYTEIDEETWEYLDSLGIYWDEKNGCYRMKIK